MNTPLNTLELSAFLRRHLDLSIASRALIEGHQAPLEYLAHVFFQGRGGFGTHGLAHPPRALDSVVWASRGGGKTFLGAVATALDLVFKPGINIRILGGSLDQSKRMHTYLRTLFDDGPFAGLVDGRITDGRLALTNGSVVELLAQSHTSVRGTRVQTLRCDEVELFREDVFDAAMLATRSKVIDIPGVGPTEIAGSIECLSTMHVPFGLMSRLVKDNTRRVFKWGVVDVLAECEKTRECSECELWTECRGKAKREGAEGEDDSESSGCVPLAEMLCASQPEGLPEGSRESSRPAAHSRSTSAELLRPECVQQRRPGTRGNKKHSKQQTKVTGRPQKKRKAATKSNPVSVTERRDLAVRARSAARDAGAEATRTSPKTPRLSSKDKGTKKTKAKEPSGAKPVTHATAPVVALAARAASEGTSFGHLSVDDAVRMKRRVSLPQWNTEMLCLEPSRADSVFPEFDPKKHVFRDWEDEEDFRAASGIALPGDVPFAADPEDTAQKGGATIAVATIDAQAASLLLAKREQERKTSGELWVCGIDFGFRAPTVILWGAVEAHTRVLRILDERIVERATTREHVEAIFKGNGRGWKLPDFVGVDPAGKQIQSQTGVADAKVLSESGLDVQAKSLGVGRGLHLIRARLAPAEGPVRLFIHVRCRGLIEAMTKYHYRVDAPEDPEPVKDGSDHAVDALRYMVLNLDVGFATTATRY